MDRDAASKPLPTYTIYKYWDAEIICLQLPFIIASAFSYLNRGFGGIPIIIFAALGTIAVIYQCMLMRKSSAGPGLWYEVLPPVVTGLGMIVCSGIAWLYTTASYRSITQESPVSLLLTSRRPPDFEPPVLYFIRIAVVSGIIVGFNCFLAGVSSAAICALHRMSGHTVAPPILPGEKQTRSSGDPETESDAQDNNIVIERKSFDLSNCIWTSILVILLCSTMVNMYIEDPLRRAVASGLGTGLAALLGEIFALCVETGRPNLGRGTTMALKGMFIVTAIAMPIWAMSDRNLEC